MASWRYTDVQKAFAEAGKPSDYLYRELQFGLKELETLERVAERIDRISVAGILCNLCLFAV